MKLTAAVVDRATYEGDGNSRFVLWDDDLPGFGLRVYPSGRKAYILSYRTRGGRKRLTTIGPHRILNLRQARDKARVLLANVVEGDDPQAQRATARSKPTVNDLCDTYVRRHAKVHKKTWEKDERRLERHVKPAWGSRHADEIIRADVAALHERIGRRTPYEANRTLEVIRKMYNVAPVWGLVPESHPNPATGIQRFREKSRDRWVTPEELPSLAQAIDAEENIFVRAALWLYMLTGARKQELLTAKWEDYNKERRELRFIETKNGETFYVPLSTPAVEILEQLPRLEGNPYIFPGIKKGRPLVNIAKPWERVRRRAGIADVRLHDLRRTVGSWMATNGMTDLLIGKVLNQKSRAATAVYARLRQDPVRVALEEHGQRVLAAAFRAPRNANENVVQGVSSDPDVEKAGDQ